MTKIKESGIMVKTIIINDENMHEEPINKKMKSRAILINSSS